MPVDTQKASTKRPLAEYAMTKTHPGRYGGVLVKGLAKSEPERVRTDCAMASTAKYVDANHSNARAATPQ